MSEPQADCRQTIAELFNFLDDELSDDTRTLVLGHLEHCTDCQGAYEFHHELKVVVADKCQRDEMPAGLLAKIEACFGDNLLGGSDGRPG
jgi:mycothiol system anti-sigma-R factor